LFCSDGGAKDNKGLFGWVIATKSKLLWECSGTATGWCANSFRSEGIGQLALLVFLDAYITYYNLDDLSAPADTPDSEPWLIIATDNKGLITRIQSGLETQKVFASAALHPEYDVVNEILEITRRLALPLKWEHVKGHQDKKRKWYELTQMETLNVKADNHTTLGLNNSEGPPRQKIPQIPSSKIALIVTGKDITSHYATHLRKAASRPAMIQRVHKHYGWLESQFEMVDWKAHHGAMQKLQFRDRKCILKFIHQSLPMGKVHRKIDPTQSLTCSTCKRHQKSETHLYRCPVRRVAIEDFYLEHTLQEFLEETHTCPQLAYPLLEALYCDLDDARYPEFGELHGANDPKFRKLQQKQAYLLGWTEDADDRCEQQWYLSLGRLRR
jgi:hypothetical protein